MSHTDLKIAIMHFNTVLSALKKEMKANTHEYLCCEMFLLLSFTLHGHVLSFLKFRKTQRV